MIESLATAQSLLIEYRQQVCESNTVLALKELAFRPAPMQCTFLVPMATASRSAPNAQGDRQHASALPQTVAVCPVLYARTELGFQVLAGCARALLVL